MEKRLFLAIVLSIFVLIIYSSVTSYFLPKPAYQEEPIEVTSESLSSVRQQTGALPSSPTLPQAVSSAVESSFKSVPTTLQNDDLYLVLNARGSGIQEASVKSYDFTLLQKDIAHLIEWQGVDFKEEYVTRGKILSYDDRSSGLAVKKTYQFSDNKYILDMTIEFVNTSNTKSYVKYGLNIASMSDEQIKKKPMEQRYMEFSISLPDKVLRKHFLKFVPSSFSEPVRWIGVRDRYFCSIIKPLQEVDRIEKSVKDGTTSYILQSRSIDLEPGQKITHRYQIYVGPQDEDLIAPMGENCTEIVNFGFFDPVSKMLKGVLKLLHRMSGNWGVTILLFSVLVYVILSPLSIKSFSSMKHMQELQPEIEELKLKHKDSPQKMNKELMELYREKKINPLGGCLPMILQMPIFVSLFQLLMRFVDLKGAEFLWIKDLSEPDKLMVFSNKLPIVGNELNVLPIVMIVIMLLQQKLTGGKQATGGQAAQQQKMMGLFMALFFGVIFYRMPSGLVLYWSVNSLLMFLFQLKMFSGKGKA